MEDLITQYTTSFLSGQALHDKSFDPFATEDIIKLFELEAYKAWAGRAAMELENEEEEEEEKEEEEERSGNYTTTTKKDRLNSAMEDAMEEFRRFEEEMNAIADTEYTSLIELGEKVRKMGKSLERSATLASKKYIEATVNSATASMRSAMKALSSKGKKVHPS